MQQIQGKFGIGGIVLGAAGFEGLTILGQGRRVDRKEHEEVVLLQRVDNRALGQFQSNRDGAAEALVQRLRPLIDGRHPVGNAIEFARLVTRRLAGKRHAWCRPNRCRHTR